MKQREIKFRGKHITTNEWVYGGFSFDKFGREVIIEFKKEIAHIVDPKTVGQLTGLKDKNGKEIFEGDICNDNGVVRFIGGRYLIMYPDGKFEDLIGDEDEIIGNIYENKDLLK